MRIITISREFGSGGRELAKRMADLLDVAYYDKEIITSIAQEHNMDEAYVSKIMDKAPLRAYPITIGRTFAYPSFIKQRETGILVSRQRVVKELAARGDCVIAGQSADAILRELGSLNLFVYADMSSKMERCKKRAPEGENLTDKELEKKIKQVDAGRAKRHELLTELKWGRKESYHLCINTTGLQIKALAPQISEYAKYWFNANNE